jgi:hypothetical protein
MAHMREDDKVQQDSVARKVQSLGDLELAMLLGIVANEPCLIQTQPQGLDSTVDAIESVSRGWIWNEGSANARSRLLLERLGSKSHASSAMSQRQLMTSVKVY